MNDRPIAAVLAAVAAVMFIAAFAGAAVLRPETAAVAGESAPASPMAATEETPAKVASPSLSRVAALPALHLPARPKPAKKHKKPAVPAPARAPVIAPVHVAPRATPRPVVTPAPRAPVATPRAAPRVTPPTYTPPPRHTAPAPAPAPKRPSSVGKTFDTSG